MSQTFRLAGVKMKPFIRWYSSTVRSIPSFSIRVRLPHTMTTTPMQDTACVIRGGAGVGKHLRGHKLWLRFGVAAVWRQTR